MKCANNCGEAETFEHMLQRNILSIPDDTAEVESWINFLRHVATKTSRTEIAIPDPLTDDESELGGEISLEEGTRMLEGAEDTLDASSKMSLSFD